MDYALLLDGKPPENITLHGAHDFVSGAEIGSVSAIIDCCDPHRKAFKRVANAPTIG